MKTIIHHLLLNHFYYLYIIAMKKVEFDSSKIYHLTDVPPSSLMTKEERNRTWYDLGELERMKQSAKEQVHFFRLASSLQLSSQQIVSSKEENVVSNDECIMFSAIESASKPFHFTKNETEPLCYRGLEARISFERIINKSDYLRKILRACKRARGHIQDAEARDDPRIDAYRNAASETLRLICSNESQKSMEVAIHTGKSDFEYVCRNEDKGISLGVREEGAVLKNSSLIPKRKSTCQASLLEYSNSNKRSRLVCTGVRNEEEIVRLVHAIVS